MAVRKKKPTWETLVAKKKDVKNYALSESFTVGEYIDHKTFGLGYVQDSFGDKIDVLFEDKARLLKHMVMF